jgi:hypothetical protein
MVRTTVIRFLILLTFAGLVGVNLIVTSAYAVPEPQPGFNDWKVTCEYNQQGDLVKKICESTSNKDCNCPLR